MWNWLKKLETETWVGGVFGFIALVAIFLEIRYRGYTAEAYAVGVKDMAGTMVAVMVFIFAAKRLIPRKQASTYEERLQQRLDEWQESHMPIISRFDIKEKLRYFMLTDPKLFFSNIPKEEAAARNAGWFVKMPIVSEENYRKPGVKLEFHLNKGTFFERESNELAEKGYARLMSLFIPFIQYKFRDYIAAGGKGQDIWVTFKDPFETDEDLDRLIQVLDTMVQQYLIAANMRI